MPFVLTLTAALLACARPEAPGAATQPSDRVLLAYTAHVGGEIEPCG